MVGVMGDPWIDFNSLQSSHLRFLFLLYIGLCLIVFLSYCLIAEEWRMEIGEQS